MSATLASSLGSDWYAASAYFTGVALGMALMWAIQRARRKVSADDVARAAIHDRGCCEERNRLAARLQEAERERDGWQITVELLQDKEAMADLLEAEKEHAEAAETKLQEAERERDLARRDFDKLATRTQAAEAREAALRGALAAASHPGFDDKAGNDAGNREQVWCRACAAHHQKRSHCPVLQSIALAADGEQS